MSHFPRLLRVLTIAAAYRLDEFVKGRPGALWVALLLAPFRLLTLFSGHGGKNRNQRLREAMERLGPIYIKFGQLLSTRRDFLDAELADELQALQDKVPPFRSPPAQQIVERALGESTATLFRSFDEQPFASASVAQVHKAVLNSGEEVVVKIIRPGIEKTIEHDIRLLKWVARHIEAGSNLGKRLRPIEVVNDYEKIIFDELDLLAEAANTSQLRSNFENSRVLYVPRVYWEFTRKNVLVMERIHGIPVTDVDALNAHKIDLKKLAETGVDIFFTQVFEHNFFHADMHPGNIFVAPDNPDSPQYIAVDCAIIGSLSNEDQEYMAKNLLAIFKRDYRRVAELHVACGWVPRETRVHEFESAMRSVCEPIFEKPLKEISFGQLLVQLFRTASRFNMEVQPSLVLLQKTLLNIEGLGRQLYPELDLWQTALPYLENWNSKRLNPFTLLAKIQENVPDWIEQIPQLPILLIDAVTQSGQLRRINESLLRREQAAEERRIRRRRRYRNGAVIALALAAIGTIPAASAAIAELPALPVGLALFGVYLLCFRP